MNGDNGTLVGHFTLYGHGIRTQTKILWAPGPFGELAQSALHLAIKVIRHPDKVFHRQILGTQLGVDPQLGKILFVQVVT